MALAEKWSDETTRKLLTKRAVNSALDETLQTEHSFALGKMQPMFGRIVLSKGLDSRGSYLNLHRPISCDHLALAAERANIPADNIDEAVRSLSEHMGWDITKRVLSWGGFQGFRWGGLL